MIGFVKVGYVFPRSSVHEHLESVVVRNGTSRLRSRSRRGSRWRLRVARLEGPTQVKVRLIKDGPIT